MLEEDIIWRFFIEICLGLHDLHRMCILHRDLKASNIFLRREPNCQLLLPRIKIGDLGLASDLSRVSKISQFAGTPLCMSPEQFQGKKYTYKSDIWGLGVLLFRMCTLKYPFNGDTKEELSENIINGNFKQIKNYSIGLVSTVKKLLVTDPEKRPNIQQIFEM